MDFLRSRLNRIAFIECMRMVSTTSLIQKIFWWLHTKTLEKQ